MTPADFRPGFRLSFIDVVVLAFGAVGTVMVFDGYRELAILGAVAVLHFFLFCNVFRVARRPELMWATVFVASVAAHQLAGLPWDIVAVVVGCASLSVIGNELHKPSYHGILWQRFNPQLREWWASRQRQSGRR